MATAREIGGQLRESLSEIKRRLAPTEFKLVEPESPRSEFIASWLGVFSDEYRELFADHRWAVAELQGAPYHLFIVGPRHDIERTYVSKIFHTTTKEPFNDRHACVRVVSKGMVRDAHLYDGQLVGVDVNLGGDELPVFLTFEEDAPNAIVHPQYNIMILGKGRINSGSPEYAGIAIRPANHKRK